MDVLQKWKIKSDKMVMQKETSVWRIIAARKSMKMRPEKDLQLNAAAFMDLEASEAWYSLDFGINPVTR